MRTADGKKKSPGKAVLIRDIYSVLDRHYGDLKWWPGETPFEVIVGAILTQNTSWDNVARAVANLKSAGMLCPFRLYSAQPGRIAGLIRPSGYYNVKTRRLRHFLHFLHGEFGGDIDAMFRLDTLELRRRLLSVNGIGEETADSILLYAGGKPVFVVDAYTNRILQRHGVIREGCSYADVKAIFESCIPPEPAVYNQYHALIVQTGKDFCRKRPLCGECPLRLLNHA